MEIFSSVMKNFVKVKSSGKQSEPNPFDEEKFKKDLLRGCMWEIPVYEDDVFKLSAGVPELDLPTDTRKFDSREFFFSTMPQIRITANNDKLNKKKHSCGD